ncbi:oligosaccharyl transferase, STT3 subunit [Thermococcus sp.]
MKMKAGILKRLTRARELILTPRYAIPILLILASAIRLLPMRFKYLLGYDPYFHLAYIRYALTHGWVNFFPYAIGPWGFQIHKFHPLGLWMTPAFVYKLLHPLGVSLYNAFRLTPVIFGVLTVVFVYGAILILYGKREAFLSAFILAVSFGHVFRSMAGYYRGDNYMLFWYSVALLGMALGLTWKPGRWRYERFAFYIIPGIATGLSAFFWQAYYPIFAFVLANAVLLSIGAFLLEKDAKILDGLAITLSTVLGVLVANWIGGKFGYGMVGYNRWLGKKLAEELGLHFGIVKDAFLLAYLEYAVPLTIGTIIALLIASRWVKGKRRILIIGGLTILVGLVVIGYYPLAENLLNRLFPQSPIAETVRATKSDWWEAYGAVGFLIPLFLLRFAPKRVQLGDFLLLGSSLVMVSMALIWTRFLFIGSLSVAILGALGLLALFDELSNVNRKTYSIALVVVILISGATAYTGINNTLKVKPIVNDNWARALEYLGNHSGINDVVLTWWDEGHWVTYFANRAPVAQGSPSRWVAKYYLGKVSEKNMMSLGVDYVIVSLDAVEKFGAILQTANEKGYVMVLLRPEPLPGVLAFSAGVYSVMATPGRAWDVRVRIGNAWGIPVKVFVERGTNVTEIPLKEEPTIDAYVYINLNYGYAVLMNGKAFETPLAKLMFTNEYPSSYKPFYSDGGVVKIFRFVHPNVEVVSENGSVVLKFYNATGTSLGVYGYLDNGTLVYKKWFNVKDKGEFVLPTNLNGSVVIRYVYVQKKTVLDRGVFRIEDVLSVYH